MLNRVQVPTTCQRVDGDSSETSQIPVHTWTVTGWRLSTTPVSRLTVTVQKPIYYLPTPVKSILYLARKHKRSIIFTPKDRLGLDSEIQ